MIPRNCENQGIIFHTCVGALAQREQRFIKLKISVIPLQARLTVSSGLDCTAVLQIQMNHANNLRNYSVVVQPRVA